MCFYLNDNNGLANKILKKYHSKNKKTDYR